MKTRVHWLISILVIASHCAAAEVNWANWRGPGQNGTAAAGNYPVTWESETALWKTAIPGKGYSTPIVWDKTIYLTTGAEGQDAVLALDWSGKIIWQKRLGPEKPGRHKNASGSNPSAVTDGDGVYVFFKSGALAALEHDGTIRWQTNLFERFGKDKRYWDFGSSPVLTEKYVVIVEMHDGDSWIAAFDKQTGDLAWKVARDFETAQEGKQGYTTPIVFSHEGQEALLVWGAHRLTAHAAADGKTLWSCGNFNPDGIRNWPSIASPVLCDDIAVVPCGRVDRRQARLHGIKLGGSGDVTQTHRLWKRTDTGSFIPSPTTYNGRIYMLGDRGRLDCIDPKTGQNLWSGDLPGEKDNFYASPLIAGGHLYAARIDGRVYVMKLGNRFEVVSEIDMKDRIIASPIALDNRLLIRTENALYCIAKNRD